MKSKYIIIIGSLALIFWIGLIFYFSSQPSNASNQQSMEVLTVYERLNSIFNISDSKILNKIESFVFDDLYGGRYDSNSKVRKTAHFAIYFILGIIASIFGWFYTKKWLIAASIGVCLPTIIAVLDEFIQGLTDRTSLLTDVVLDAVGAFMGMCLFMLVLFVYRKVIKRGK
ncbi:MAG TPA: VanZ family protein [Fusibacter sp.]|nr:VanZ family protein [Fusibacter sp.]